MKKIKRICVKVGSNVLTEKNGRLNIARIGALVGQFVKLAEQGIEVVFISSGAVAAGRNLVLPDEPSDEVSKRQLWAAIGQVHLMNLYERLFSEYAIQCAQVLVTKTDFDDEQHYQNMQNCFKVLLKNKVLPIVNENDTVAISELMFTDNDELAGLVAKIINADALIILSNIDGFFTDDPSSPTAKLIKKIKISDDFSKYVKASKSSFGRGGMHTKYRIACNVAKNGIDVFLANGDKENIIINILNGTEKNYTHFSKK